MTDENPVTVIARFAPTPERAAQLKALLGGMVEPTRAEPGCRRYDLFTAREGDTEFVLVERYEDTPALEAHRASAHYKNYRAQLPEMLAKPIEVTVLAPVDVVD
ncbi:putative quinol monooxygenase [Amycolatopsis silviterrae]|uniref:Quinol monooxygenase n=1 Tax=Amycolatopsis silviterrae TaxID=1656914 RepID=A0ABW5H3W1_9PSEU